MPEMNIIGKLHKRDCEFHTFYWFSRLFGICAQAKRIILRVWNHFTTKSYLDIPCWCTHQLKKPSSAQSKPNTPTWYNTVLNLVLLDHEEEPWKRNYHYPPVIKSVLLTRQQSGCHCLIDTELNEKNNCLLTTDFVCSMEMFHEILKTRWKKQETMIGTKIIFQCDGKSAKLAHATPIIRINS